MKATIEVNDSKATDFVKTFVLALCILAKLPTRKSRARMLKIMQNQLEEEE